MYKAKPDSLAKAVQQPSSKSLRNLDFTPTQVRAVLEVIKDGVEPWAAIAKIARTGAAVQLRSSSLAETVSDSMSEGLGYSAAVSRARHLDAHTGSSDAVNVDSAHEGAKYDDLDVDDGSGADDDPGPDARRLLD